MATKTILVEGTSTTNDDKNNEFHIVLGVTGSVAAIKVPEIVVQLLSDDYDDDDDKGGKNFWDKSSTYNPIIWNRFQQILQSDENQNQNRHNKKQIEIINYNDEWNDWNSIGDDVAHISIRNWADILVIVPLSAHTLAKIANGLCDDTLSCIVRAWPTHTSTSSGTSREMKPIILVPAMNTAMWEHPITQQQIQTIQSFYTKPTMTTTTVTTVPVIGQCTSTATSTTTNAADDSSCVIIQPQSKMLACGDIGTGALASVDIIVDIIRRYM